MSSQIVKVAGKTLAKVAGKGGKIIAQDINPLDALREYCEYMKAAQAERTRREDIRARRDVAVTAIQSQRELIEKYFELRFAERKTALSGFLDLLTHAVDARNETELNVALNGILGIVRDSPLKDFEAFRQARLEGQTIEI